MHFMSDLADLPIVQKMEAIFTFLSVYFRSKFSSGMVLGNVLVP